MTNKLIGFRTNKLWKKIIASIYYISNIIILLSSIIDKPKINASIYDIVIYKLSNTIMNLSFIIPIIAISDIKFKDKIPILKANKYWTKILSITISITIIIGCSNIISLFHTNDYKIRYEEYNKTQIIYQNENKEDITKENEHNLLDNEITNNKENTEENDTNSNHNISDKTPLNNDNETNNNNNKEPPKITIHYIDVGQGDSIFIELPTNKTMLIDAGESSKETIVANYIKNQGYSKIDYLIGTHPHVDHIGGLSYIINNFNIGNIYMPKALSTSKTYENLLKNISANNLKVIKAMAGVSILNNEDLKINILAPNKNNYNNLNNYSAVIKINYLNKSFLFMGDAEIISENEILTDVSADVIKIGHHGSETSSGENFINKVKPQIAIIMVGENNKYNHPSDNIISRWKEQGTKIYRTDLNGNIIISSDGNIIEVNTSK